MCVCGCVTPFSVGVGSSLPGPCPALGLSWASPHQRALWRAVARAGVRGPSAQLCWPPAETPNYARLPPHGIAHIWHGTHPSSQATADTGDGARAAGLKAGAETQQDIFGEPPGRAVLPLLQGRLSVEALVHQMLWEDRSSAQGVCPAQRWPELTEGPGDMHTRAVFCALPVAVIGYHRDGPTSCFPDTC